jgi:hypothetical protein
MNRFKFGAMFVCVTLLVLAFSAGARADDWNKASIVTFTEPVEVPGVGAQVLPPGTYVFKLLDHQSDRSVVQILNERRDHVFSTILAIPNFRVQTTTKTVTTYTDQGSGEPQALKAWFYPSLNWGWEFVYPKTRAIELAKMTNQPILAMPAELASTLVEPIKSADEPQVVALKAAPVEAVKPTGEVVPMAEVVEPPPVEMAAVRSTELDKRLPKTASPVPLLGLIGFLSVAASLGLSGISKRLF